MVADLVGDHIGLGELARRAEPVGKLAEEAEVDVDPVVARAIERPHRRLAAAAGGLGGAVVGHEDGGLILEAPALELPPPDVLGRAEDLGREMHQRIVRSRLGRALEAAVRTLRRRRGGLLAAEQLGGIDPEHQGDEQADDAQPPAANHHRAAESAAAILGAFALTCRSSSRMRSSGVCASLRGQAAAFQPRLGSLTPPPIGGHLGE